MTAQGSKWIAYIAPVALAGLLAGCDPSPYAGHRESQQRQVTSFDSIRIRGAGKMEITVGPAESVTVSGDSRAISHVTTAVRGNTLVVSRDRDWYWLDGNDRLTIAITLPKLTALRLQGAGEVEVAGLNGGNSTIAFSGAGHVHAMGKVDDLTVSLNGAGRGDFGQLEARNATVTMSGAGNIIVRCTEMLDATLNGVGSIEYEGNPTKISSAIHGLGSINARSDRKAARDAKRHAKRHWKWERDRDRDDDKDKREDKDSDKKADPDAEAVEL